jgi:dTDP-glucose pyrophosphorylase/CBS domain-containing protein
MSDRGRVSGRRRKFEKLLVTPERTLLEIMAVINEVGHGVAIVVDEQERLLDLVTDGDLRRAVLKGRNLKMPFSEFRHADHRPFTLPVGTSRLRAFAFMREKQLRQIPLIDCDGRITDLIELDELVSENEFPTAVVMAGGFGTRLRPLTNNVPKPLLPVGDKPVLQRTVEQLKSSGVIRVHMATHYMPEAISDHFGNGKAYGVDIDYVHEQQPLGTAGVLSLIAEKQAESPLLVVNGDIVTRVSYRAMFDFHRESQADMTVAVRQYEFSVPYGVVDTDGSEILGIREKPTSKMFVNAGIYILGPQVPRYVPSGRRFDMTDLIAALLTDRKRVVPFPISEYWLDIGQMDDYERAQYDAQNGRLT